MPAPALLSEPAIVSATGIDLIFVYLVPLLLLSRKSQLCRESAEPAVTKARLAAVAADGLDRATFLRFLAKRFFLGTLRLLIDKGMAAVVVALEIRGRGFAAQIAIDALVIDVKFTVYVFRIFVCGISHFRFSRIGSCEG